MTKKKASSKGSRRHKPAVRQREQADLQRTDSGIDPNFFGCLFKRVPVSDGVPAAALFTKAGKHKCLGHRSLGPCENAAEFAVVTLGKVPDDQGGLQKVVCMTWLCCTCVAASHFHDDFDDRNEPLSPGETYEEHTWRQQAVAIVPIGISAEDVDVLTDQLKRFDEHAAEDDEAEEENAPDSTMQPAATVIALRCRDYARILR